VGTSASPTATDGRAGSNQDVVVPRSRGRAAIRPATRPSRTIHQQSERSTTTSTAVITIVVIAALVVLIGIEMRVRIVKEYEKGVVFRFGRVTGALDAGFRLMIPFVDVMHRVSLWIITMPIQSQGIITRDDVSVSLSAVAYSRVVDAVKSVVGQHTLDETLSEADRINEDIREILDLNTVDWGVEVTLVELKDIQLPDLMKRAMARQAEAERESAQRSSTPWASRWPPPRWVGDASDLMMEHSLALRLRASQSLVEIGVDKNTTVVFPPR
jgi:hypothetical protein